MLQKYIKGVMNKSHRSSWELLTLKVLVTTIDAQWEGMGDVGQQGTSWHYFPHARPKVF